MGEDAGGIFPRPAPRLHHPVQARPGYRLFFKFVEDPANGLMNLTLPYEGGLELVVKV